MTPCATKKTDFRKNMLEEVGPSTVAVKDQNIRRHIPYLLFAIHVNSSNKA
jgi:hypothetical protein